MTNKLAATKTAIVLLMEAQSPCTMREIYNEVQQQAYTGKMAQALRELEQGGFIRWDEEYRCFDLVD